MKIIRFRRLSNPKYVIVVDGIKIQAWEIAFNEQGLFAKLQGGLAEIIMPDECLLIRLWRRIFPLKGVEGKLEE